MDRRITVTGKEVGRGGPRTIEIHSSQVAEALEETVDTILDTIRRALEQVSPALLSDIKDRGILLTGGGALLTGLDKLIQKMTGIETRIAENPLTSVVMGCAIALEDPELHMGSYLSKN
jgi:rod shape-determining protein MreB